MSEVLLMETERQLALIIKEAREKAGYTQEKLSLKIGKSDKYIGAVECGRLVPPYPVLKRIVLELRLDGNSLFYDNNDDFSFEIARLYLQRMNPLKRKLALELLKAISEFNDN